MSVQPPDPGLKPSGLFSIAASRQEFYKAHWDGFLHMPGLKAALPSFIPTGKKRYVTPYCLAATKTKHESISPFPAALKKPDPP